MTPLKELNQINSRLSLTFCDSWFHQAPSKKLHMEPKEHKTVCSSRLTCRLGMVLITDHINTICWSNGLFVSSATDPLLQT